MSNTVTIRTTAPGAKQTAAELDKVGKSAQGIGGMAKSGLGTLGASLGGLVNPAFLAVGAVGAVAGALANGAKSAIEEKEQLGRLDQALKNNVANWDGNRDAIDKAIDKGMDMAFTDDALRESLIKLVPAARNANKAIRLQQLAMDIARGRNIDLATAMDIVIKANMGNAGALRRMGIELGGAATATQLLTKLEQTYANQAEVFADSAEGRIQRGKIRLDEAMEDGGEAISNMFGEGIIAADDFWTTAAHLGDRMSKEVFGDPGRNIDVADMFQVSALTRVAERAGEDVGVGFGQGVESRADNIRRAANVAITQQIVAETQHAAEVMGRSARAIDNDLAGALRGNKDVVKDAMDAVTWAIKHPMALTRQIANIEGAITTLEYKRGLSSNTEGINTVIDQQLENLRDQWENLTGRAYTAGANAGMAWTNGYWRNLTPGAKKGDLTKRDYWDSGFRFPGSGRHKRPGKHARGGMIAPGEWSWVGEEGPELIQGGGGGTRVMNNTQSNAMAAQPVEVHVHLEGDAAQLFRVVDREQGRSLALAQSSSYARG